MKKTNVHIYHLHLYQHIQKYLKSKALNCFVLFFILIAIVSIILSSFEEMKEYSSRFFHIIYISSMVFLCEYILRILSAPANYPNISAIKARCKYVLSFYGIVDFVAILPVILVHTFWNTHLVHALILPYVFIIFKLIRYSRSFRMIGSVLSSVRNELFTAYTACLILVCFSAILMFYIEHAAQPERFQNIGDAFWWAIVTFTTVGYGDIYPVTPLGKILSGIISLIGIAMIAIPTGIISSAFLAFIKEKEHKQEKEE